MRLHARQAAIALSAADLDAAADHIAGYRELMAGTAPRGSFDARFPVLAARTMLGLRRRADIDFWIDAAMRIEGPPVTAHAATPTLRAWRAFHFGDLHDALRHSEAAVAWVLAHEPAANHLTFDTLVTGGWCRAGVGDLAGAEELSRMATAHADVLGQPWQRLQAGHLAAQLALYRRDPAQALSTIDDLRADIPFDSCRPYSDRIAALELEARASEAEPASPPSPDGRSALRAKAQLLRAKRAAPGAPIDELLSDREQWILEDLIQAELLLHARGGQVSSDATLRKLVTACAEKGWVMPFLGLDDRSLERIMALPLADLHPALLQQLARLPQDGRGSSPQHTLTAREASLIPLLETHLSYAEMGQTLYLSVNTVKSNLQRLYRKMGARTRGEAVAAARELGLL